MSSEGWKEVERAEARLDERAGERVRARRRRARRATIVRWLLSVALPVAGSAAFTAIVEAAGGDLGGWSEAEAIGVVLAATLVPALCAGWLWRRHGVVIALGAGLAVVLAVVALTVGVGFVLLGYGPE